MVRRKSVHLPGELLLVIFDDGRPSSQDEVAWSRFYLDLYHFALVHRTWTAWAQDLLFTHVWPKCGFDPYLQSTSSSLDNLLCAPRHLRLKTRSITLRLGRSLIQGGPRISTRVLGKHGSWDQFAAILRSYTGVHTLQLDLHALDVLQMEMDTEQLAVVLQYHALRRLTICPYVTPPEEALNQLFISWPQLTRLELSGPLMRLFHFAPDRPPPCALSHLRELVLWLEVGEDAQNWLRATFAGASQLRVLRCAVADLETFVDMLHGSLQDLTVDFPAGTMFEHSVIASLARCSRLHTLMLTDDTLVASALQFFPTNLKHLSLLADPRLLLGSNLNWSTMQTIAVAWPLGMRDPNVDVDGAAAQKGHKELQERCSKNGIEYTLLDEVPDRWTS